MDTQTRPKTLDELIRKYGSQSITPISNTYQNDDFFKPRDEGPSYFQEAGQDIKQTGQNLATTFRNTQQGVGNSVVDFISGKQGGLRTAGQIFGKTAGGISGAIGDVFTGAAKTVLPQGAEDAIKSGLQKVTTPIVQSHPVQTLIQRYNSLNPQQKSDVDALLGVGSLALDLASFSPGAKVGSKAGELAVEGAGKTADLAAMPAKLAGKAVGKSASEVLGLTTGAGSDVIEQAFLNPTKDLKAAMRGGIQKTDIVDAFNNALSKVKDQRGLEYRAALENIGKESQKSLDLSPVYQKIESQMEDLGVKVGSDGSLDFGRSAIMTPTEQSKVQKIFDTLKGWGSQPGDRTPVGVDKLKKIVDNFVPESGAGSKFGNEVKGSIKKILNEQVPGYEKMTSRYAETSDFIDEVNKSLGIGGNRGMETAINKITSALAENKEYRKSLVSELESIGKTHLKDKIAGAALSTWLPRGIVSRFLGGGLIGTSYTTMGNILTGVAVALPTFSPRVVGELMVALGMSAKRAKGAANIVGYLMKKLGKVGGGAAGAGAVPMIQEQLRNQ